MSNNALTVFDPNNVQLPAHILAAQEQLGSNIPDKQTVPSLSYKGKVWSIKLDGNETKLARPNADGDMEPLSIFRGVVLNYNNVRGRAYYVGAYDPNATVQPICWSADGKTPDASLPLPDTLPTSLTAADRAKTPHRQASACSECSRSVKGSKITEQGKSTTECGQHRMLAVVPSFKLDFVPLRLKIAVTSDWDKDLVEHGWFAWQQYVDYLKSRGIINTASVVTKMKFDQNEAYPKVMFGVDRFLNEAEMDYIAPLTKSEQVTDLLAEKWTAAGVDGTSNQPEPANDTAALQAARAEQAAKAKLAEEEAADAALAAQLKREAAEKVTAAAQQVITVPDDDGADDDAALAASLAAATSGTQTAPAQAATAAAAQPKKTGTPAPVASTAVPADVADLLAQWNP